MKNPSINPTVEVSKDRVYLEDKLYTPFIKFKNFDFSKSQVSEKIDICNNITFENCTNIENFEFPEKCYTITYINSKVPSSSPLHSFVNVIED